MHFQKNKMRRTAREEAMKLRNNIDNARFLKTVETCHGEVWFRTAEGDSLNLKSTLSQMVFAVAAGGALSGCAGEIVCEEEEDLELLKGYLTE